MSATTTFPDGPVIEPNAPVRSAQVLINLIVTMLAPMFLTAVGGDLNHARIAAAETIASYRVESPADLIVAAKIVAFGLAALGSLSLSMDDNLPAAMILRLRANAVACDRAEHRNHCMLKQTRADKRIVPDPSPASPPDPEPEPDEAALLAAVAETQKRTADHLERLSAQSAQAGSMPSHEEQQNLAAWAASAAEFVAENAAGLAHLSPEQRRDATIWIQAMNAAANEFLDANGSSHPLPSDPSRMAPAGGP
jgi:hypothetical protein